MGITQNTGASSLIKPGVIDNTAARPASPYEGQVIYQKDTNQILAYDGASWTMVNDLDTPSGLQLVAKQTFSSATSVDTKQCFTSEYTWYKIMIEFTTASGYLYLQLIDGTTPTVINSGSYVSAGFRVTYNGSLATANDSFTTAYTISTTGINANAAFTVDFRYNNSGQSMWTSTGTTTAFGETFHKSGGYHAVVNHDGFRLLSDQNMSGTVCVYGYRK